MKQSDAWGLCGAILFPCSAILGFAALSKLRSDIRLFEAAIEKYQLVPHMFLPASARLIISLELIIVMLTLIPLRLDVLAYFLIATGCMFFIAQSSVMIRGLNIACGCFGDKDSTIGFKTISFPIALLIIGVVALTIIRSLDFKWTLSSVGIYYCFGIATTVMGIAVFKTFYYESVFRLKKFT